MDFKCKVQDCQNYGDLWVYCEQHEDHYKKTWLGRLYLAYKKHKQFKKWYKAMKAEQEQGEEDSTYKSCPYQ